MHNDLFIQQPHASTNSYLKASPRSSHHAILRTMLLGIKPKSIRYLILPNQTHANSITFLRSQSQSCT